MIEFFVELAELKKKKKEKINTHAWDLFLLT